MPLKIAKLIFEMSRTVMKKILDLGQYKLGKKSEDFLYYKQQVMESTYINLKKLFKQMEENKIIEKCSCGANLRKGYKSCDLCGGSGYKNK